MVYNTPGYSVLHNLIMNVNIFGGFYRDLKKTSDGLVSKWVVCLPEPIAADFLTDLGI